MPADRAWVTRCLALLSLAVLPSCSADRTVGPGGPAAPETVAEVFCTGDRERGTISCAPPHTSLDDPGTRLFGGQGMQITLSATNVAYDNGTEKFTFDVALQNLTSVAIGFDGVAPTGVRVFFESVPVATSGSGTIAVENDSLGTFTAAGQHYYVFPGKADPAAILGPVTWQFDIPGTVNTFSFAVLLSADVMDLGGVSHWRSVGALDRRLISAVAYASPTSIMAVGVGGVTMHYDGSAWTELGRIRTLDLRAVAADTGGRFLAVGDGGYALYGNGTQWVEFPFALPGGTTPLAHAWILDTTRYIVGGQSGVVIWRDALGVHSTDAGGGSGASGRAPLMRASSLGSDSIVGVTATAHGDTFAVLTQSNIIWRAVDNGAFAPWDSAPGIPGAIGYDADGALLWSWYDTVAATGYLLRRGAASDTIFDDPAIYLRSMELLPDDHLLAGIADAVSGTGAVGLFDLSGSAAVLGPVSTALDTITAAVTRMTASGDQYLAVPRPAAGDLLRWDGSAWHSAQGASAGDQFGVWGIGDTAFIVNGGDRPYRLVKGVVTPLPSLPGAHAIWGVSSTELYVLTSDSIFSWHGGGSWTGEFEVQHHDAGQIWGDPTGGLIFVIGGGPWLIARISGSWIAGGLSEDLLSVGGCSSTEAWVGGTSKVFRWNGSSLLEWTAPGAPIRAVTGTQCNDMWFAGEGKLLHRDGSGIHDLSAPGQYHAATPRTSHQVYLGGEGDALDRRTDAGDLIPIPIPSQGRTITGLWRLASGEVIAGGSGFVLRGIP